VYSSVAFKAVLATVLSVAAVVLAWAIGTTGDALTLVAIGCVGMIFTVINEVFVGSMAGLEWMGRPALWSTVQIWVGSAVGIAVLLAGGGVIAYGIAFSASLAIPMLANGRVAWHWTTGTRKFDWAVVRRVLVGGAPLMVVSALTLVYGTINVPILTRIAGETTTGWFTLAVRFVGIPVFIVTAATTAFFPSLSAHGVAQSAGFARLVNRAIRLVVVITVPAAAGLAVIASDLIELLYGARFAESVPIIQIMSIHIPVMAIDVILAIALIASDRQNQYLVVAGVAALISPIAGVVAINWSIDRFDNGAIGVAIVAVGTEVLILVGALLLRAKGVMDRATTWVCLRCLLAGAAMAAVVWAMGEWPLAVRIVAGGIVYALASLALGTVTMADARHGAAIVSSAVARIRRSPGSNEAG
jgi:O-antigen/teichoic acid export membrane protein